MVIFGEVGNPVPWVGEVYREEPEGFIVSGHSLSPVFADIGIASGSGGYGTPYPSEPLDPTASIHDGGVTGLDGPADIYWRQRTGVPRYIKRELLRVWDAPTAGTEVWEDFRSIFEQPVSTVFPAAPARPKPRGKPTKPPGGMWVPAPVPSLLEIKRDGVVMVTGTKDGSINVEANDDSAITGGDSSASIEQDDAVAV